MIFAVILLAVVLLAVLEKIWAPMTLKTLRFQGSTDKLLAEPGETVVWRGEVENQSKLPVFFARLWESFPLEAKLQGDPKWIRSHKTESIKQWHIEERMFLLPRQRVTRSAAFVFDQRGTYHVGKYRLSAGDLLGLSEETKHGEGQELVVMPQRSKDGTAIEALGGFLGDISVRRFILEDPILTVGFRDYTGREPMKSISWTRTAMTGTMQVRQFDHTAEQTVAVLLNVEGGSDAELEECFRLTRSVCEELERKKIPYVFRTNGNLTGPVGKLFYMPEGLGQVHWSTIMYGLGKADHTRYMSFRYLVNQTLKHRRSNEAYIVITPELDGQGIASVRMLEGAVGSGLCLLVAKCQEGSI